MQKQGQEEEEEEESSESRDMRVTNVHGHSSFEALLAACEFALDGDGIY